jgi:7-cyano-7-deazaguanine synthase
LATKALVLLSGGMDSAVCLAIAKRDCNEVEALSLSYGQKHVKEIDSAIALAAHYDIRLQVMELPKIFAGAGSVLVDKGTKMPRLSYEELGKSEGPSPTYVPQRNMNFLATAAALALVGKHDLIYFGPHADDAHNWAYPDCTPEFIGAMANAIFVGSYYKTRLVTPIMWMTKAEIARLGQNLLVPFAKTWSCYDGEELHCGTCPTCVSRIEAFRRAGLLDPTKYANAA